MKVNRGAFNRQFFAFKDGDPGGGGGETYTLDAAKAKLRDDGMVVMTQKAFDAIVDEKYTKAYDKAKTEVRTEIEKEFKSDDKLKTENEKLKSQLEELKKEKGDLIPRGEHEKLLKVEQDKLSERDAKIEKLHSAQKEAAIYKAAAASVDPETVVALLRDKFKMDDAGTVFPVDEKGERVVGKEGFLTPEQFIADFLKQKPHLAKDASAPGTGSSSSGDGGKPAPTGKYTSEQLLKMPMEEYEKVGGMSALAS